MSAVSVALLTSASESSCTWRRVCSSCASSHWLVGSVPPRGAGGSAAAMSCNSCCLTSTFSRRRIAFSSAIESGFGCGGAVEELLGCGGAAAEQEAAEEEAFGLMEVSTTGGGNQPPALARVVARGAVLLDGGQNIFCCAVCVVRARAISETPRHVFTAGTRYYKPISYCDLQAQTIVSEHRCRDQSRMQLCGRHHHADTTARCRGDSRTP